MEHIEASDEYLKQLEEQNRKYLENLHACQVGEISGEEYAERRQTIIDTKLRIIERNERICETHKTPFDWHEDGSIQVPYCMECERELETNFAKPKRGRKIVSVGLMALCILTIIGCRSDSDYWQEWKRAEDKQYDRRYTAIVIDSCEYIEIETMSSMDSPHRFSITHKGNCKNPIHLNRAF